MKIDPNILRKHILDMVYDKQSGHIGGSFSICEIVAYLYSNYDLINKDKLILSKGHGVPAIYAALHELGYIENFDLFREINSPLQGHPDKNKLKYIHATTGSLGQGLSIAIGHALACKLKKLDNKIFCIVGDGEMQEGQIWEAFMLAPKLKLDNLICIIDYNKFQSEGPTENLLERLAVKIRAFNWITCEIDGNDLDQINKSLICYNNEIKDNWYSKPYCIIAHTRKGAGISFLENTNCHSMILSEEQYKLALKELNDKI